MKKIILLGLMLVLAFSPYLTLAQSTTNPCTLEGLKANNNRVSTLPMCVNQIYKWSLGVGALLALLMTIAGGYYKMTASGNAEQSAKGTEMIWSSVIGLALLFGAFLLLRTINPDLVQFKIGNQYCSKGTDLITATSQSDCTSQGGVWFQVGGDESSSSGSTTNPSNSVRQ